ncbi:integrase arm-type DNA-binding domain-containing protein [bacterium]|nr:integrase arm-type DNA-binding domain-containing protein [bacterium]
MSAFEIKRIYESAKNGTRHAVGGVSGLELQKSKSGSCSWVLRTIVNGKRREIGVGGYPSVALKYARDEAQRLKNEIRQGTDPLAEKAIRKIKIKEMQKFDLTFGDAAERYLKIKLKEFQNPKHSRQWTSTLATYAYELHPKKVSDIQPSDIIDVLKPIWLTKTETASRLRGRIEKILDWASFHGHRNGENPARWKGNLELTLQNPSSLKNLTHHPALKLQDAANWYDDLNKRSGIAAVALKFTVLTLARSGEVRGANWSEIEDDVWIIPAERTKTKHEHRIALSNKALELLNNLNRDSTLIFPNNRGGNLSDAALSSCMSRINTDAINPYLDRISNRPAVPHGLRSTFRDWAAEMTEFPSDMAEIALGHRVGSATELAYRRGDMLEKRRLMMEDWCSFLEGKYHYDANK